MESSTSPAQEPKLSWSHPIATRDGTMAADSKMVNSYIENTENGMAAVKRPGTLLVYSVSGTPQGQFACGGNGYSIVNDTIVNIATGALLAIPGVTVGGQSYDVLSDVPQFTSLFKSPTGLWIFNAVGPTVTKVTDVNYPAATVPGIAYLDGVFYVMNTIGEVLGSALEDPTTWPPLDFIQADFTLGQGAGICRHLNYVVAFYTRGTQMYYDANAAPNGQGTALGPATNASWTTGCAAGYTILEMSDVTFFMAEDRTFGRTMQQFNGLAISQFSTPAVERILNRSNLVGSFAFGIRTAGHMFYILTMPDINITLVYDQLTQQWCTWSSVVNGVEQYFSARYYISSRTLDLVQDLSTGATVAITPASFVDTTGPINVQLVTPNMDWETMSWKRFKALYLLADSASTTVYISYTDDDYSTFSTPRAVSMSSVRKMLQRCGRSRRRAWKLTHVDSTSLKVYNTIFELSVGPA